MTTNMFHDGDLNSGITLAIQEKKLVACFVRQDDNDLSSTWEEEWLTQEYVSCDGDVCVKSALGQLIGAKAVLLRIQLDSRESQFLNAFCPITSAPALVIIHNGQVLEKLEHSVSHDQFVGRLSKTVGLGLETSTGGDSSLQKDDSTPAAADAASQPSELAPTESTAQQPQSSNIDSMLTERARRLEADRLRREAAEKAERIARANARRKEAEEASAAHDKGKQRATTEASEQQKARDAWVYQQKQRKEEARKERERILAQIESDKQERRAKAQREKQADVLGGAGASSEMKGARSSVPLTGGGKCSLQIRLFDGSSIRGKFAPDADLATAVRTWVQEASPEGGADIPYNFRQILAPKPSRSIEVSEEHQSLQELGLIPNATLVLVPIAGSVSAYSSAGAGTGYVNSALQYASWATGSAFQMLGTALSYVPGATRLASTEGPYMGGTGDEQEPGNVESARMAGSDDAYAASGSGAGTVKARVKTLADQRADAAKKDQAEFYNGNSLGFEGRKDDEGKGLDSS